MPCNDVHNGMKGSIITVTEAQSHHESDNDVCSPFCICSCCQGFVALTHLSDIAIYVEDIQANFSNKSEAFIASSLAAIWQPPKIS